MVIWDYMKDIQVVLMVIAIGIFFWGLTNVGFFMMLFSINIGLLNLNGKFKKMK